MKSIKKNLIITNISIIVFMKLLPEYKNLILKYAEECDQSKKNEKNQKQPGRPREFSNVTVLYYICMMLEHVVKWRSLYFVTKDKKKIFIQQYISVSLIGLPMEFSKKHIRKY